MLGIYCGTCGKAAGNMGGSEEDSSPPEFPNPFNPETWIPYRLAEDVDVAIRIYGTSGHLIRNLNLGHKPAGFYTTKSKAAHWDGKNGAGERVASGVYFYTIQAGEFTATKKMVVAQRAIHDEDLSPVLQQVNVLLSNVLFLNRTSFICQI